MEIIEILKLIPVLLGAVSAVVAFVAAWKAKRKAKTAEEKAKAELEMEEAAKTFIADAETLYKAYDTMAKQNGGSAGALKKETVLAKLRTYAIEKGITLDVAFWTDKIDELVAFTKSVNAKK